MSKWDTMNKVFIGKQDKNNNELYDGCKIKFNPLKWTDQITLEGVIRYNNTFKTYFIHAEEIVYYLSDVCNIEVVTS